MPAPFARGARVNEVGLGVQGVPRVPRVLRVPGVPGVLRVPRVPRVLAVCEDEAVLGALLGYSAARIRELAGS